MPLERGHGAVIGDSVSRFPGMHRWFNSRRQLINRLEGGWIELIIPSISNPQVEGLANTGAG